MDLEDSAEAVVVSAWESASDSGSAWATELAEGSA